MKEKQTNLNWGYTVKDQIPISPRLILGKRFKTITSEEPIIKGDRVELYIMMEGRKTLLSVHRATFPTIFDCEFRKKDLVLVRDGKALMFVEAADEESK